MKFKLTNNVTGESITIDQPTETAATFVTQLISNGLDEEYSIVKITENDDIYSKLRTIGLTHDQCDSVCDLIDEYYTKK